MRSFLVKIYFLLLRIAATPRNFLYCIFKGVKYDFSWHFIGLPLLQRRRGAKIIIGRGFKSCSKPKWNSIGVFQRVMLKANMPGAQIVIGDDTGMSGCVISAAKFVQIGSHVLIGSGALITDSDAHPLDWRSRRQQGRCVVVPVVVGDDVFIGARAIVLKGVSIGDRSVIGAGAVVAKDVPADCVVVGNPARVVKRL